MKTERDRDNSSLLPILLHPWEDVGDLGEEECGLVWVWHIFCHEMKPKPEFWSWKWTQWSSHLQKQHRQETLRQLLHGLYAPSGWMGSTKPPQDLERHMPNMAKHPPCLCQEGDVNLYLVITWQPVTQGIKYELTFPTRTCLYLLLSKRFEICLLYTSDAADDWLVV